MNARVSIALCVSLLFGGALGGCGRSACVNEVINAIPSPDGAVIAFVFHRRCGADAGPSTNVSVVSFHDSLRGAGNVLAVDSDQPIKIAWRSPTSLRVSGFHQPRYQHAQPMGSIAVEFR